MRTRREREDIGSGAFWLGCAGLLCYRGIQLGLGSLADPGPGFIMFGAAAALALLAVVLVLAARVRGRREGEEGREGIAWGRITLILVSLSLYAILLPRIGFVLSTFLLVAVVLRIIERKKWYVILLVGLAVALGTYGVFEVWLQTRLPRGVLGF